MSEEVLGAIKFQHQSLLNLIDYYRSRITELTRIVAMSKAKLEELESGGYIISIVIDCSEIMELRRRNEELERRLADREAMPPPRIASIPQQRYDFWKLLM